MASSTISTSRFTSKMSGCGAARQWRGGRARQTAATVRCWPHRGVAIGRAGFEQARIVKAAIGVRCAARGVAASAVGRMQSSSDEIGLATQHLFARRRRRLRLRARAETPRHRFEIAERGGARLRQARAAFADAGRRRAEAGGARRLGRRQFVIAFDARDLFDEIGLALDIAPPGRRLDDDALAALPSALVSKPSAFSTRARASASRRCPRGRTRSGSKMIACGAGHIAGDHYFARLAAAEIEDQRASPIRGRARRSQDQRRARSDIARR